MKKTLLIAAAALAAGIISTQASSVYSQNIVGYVNTVLPGSGAYTMICNPLSGATNVDTAMPSIQSGDVVYLWTGTDYASYTYIGAGVGDNGYSFVDVNNAWVPSPVVVPGQGFFFSTGSGSTETNTFTGNVLSTNNVFLAGSGAYSMVGSSIPYAGAIDNTNINLPFSSGDVVYLWSGTDYASYTFIGTGVGDNGYSFVDVNNAWVPSPTLTVGQGFFYSTGSGSSANWTQNITTQ